MSTVLPLIYIFFSLFILQPLRYSPPSRSLYCLLSLFLVFVGESWKPLDFNQRVIRIRAPISRITPSLLCCLRKKTKKSINFCKQSSSFALSLVLNTHTQQPSCWSWSITTHTWFEWPQIKRVGVMSERMESSSIESSTVSSMTMMEEDEHPHQFSSISKLHSNGPTTTSVHDLLECPVCTNSMYPPIHQVLLLSDPFLPFGFASKNSLICFFPVMLCLYDLFVPVFAFLFLICSY